MNVKQNIKLLICCALCAMTTVYAATTENVITNPGFDNSSVAIGTSGNQTDTGFWVAGWIFDGVASGVSNVNPGLSTEASSRTLAFLAYNYNLDDGTATQYFSSEASKFTVSFNIAQSISNSVIYDGDGVVDVYLDNRRIAKHLRPSNYAFENYKISVENISDTGPMHSITFRAVSSSATSEIFAGQPKTGEIYLDDVVVTAEY